MIIKHPTFGTTKNKNKSDRYENLIFRNHIQTAYLESYSIGIMATEKDHPQSS